MRTHMPWHAGGSQADLEELVLSSMWVPGQQRLHLPSPAPPAPAVAFKNHLCGLPFQNTVL